MQKVDLIIRDACGDHTREIVESYGQLLWVEQIIISCWSGDPETECGDKTVRSLPLSNNGIGDRNAQIVTSHKGLLEVKSEFCATLRGDQKIPLERMNKMYHHMMNQPDKICVEELCELFPFYLSDNVFWGPTYEVAELFDIPLDKNLSLQDCRSIPGFYTTSTRTECYIVSQYLAKKHNQAKRMVENPQIFLYDFSPQREDAKRLSDELMPKYFSSFPKP